MTADFDADVSFLSYSLIILYNLVFDQKILQELKESKLIDALKKIVVIDNSVLRFTSVTLIKILESNELPVEKETPTVVAQSYLHLIERTIDEIETTYHGIKLEGVLTNLESKSVAVEKPNFTFLADRNFSG